MFTHKQYNSINIVPDVAHPLSVAAVLPEDVLPQLNSAVYFLLMHCDVSEKGNSSSWSGD